MLSCSCLYCIAPLYTGQDSGNIIGRTPAVLQDVQTQLSGGVDVGVKHGADKLDTRRFVGILLFKVHDESEGAVFERCV